MNRCVITNEEIRGREYLISALYDETGKMIELFPESADGRRVRLGDIYVGRVEKILPNLNAAFVRVGPEESCYFSLENLKNPIFVRKYSVKKEIAAGDELLVQVEKEAAKKKQASVTANLNFSGTYVIVTTGNRKYGVSAKLSRGQRAHFMELLTEHCGPEGTGEYGVIVRTNAAGTEDGRILAELEMLKKYCMSILANANHRTCFSLVHKEPPFYLKHIAGIRRDTLGEIVTDDAAVFHTLCETYHIPPEKLHTEGSRSVPVNEVETENGIRLRLYTDEIVSLSALCSVRSNIENAVNERVWLKSGAYLVIQPTEALTVIDVNTGKNTAKKNVQENFLRVNKEAALEIARQLRLRNISGIVIVDFINLASKEAEEELRSVFRQALKEDPVTANVIDMTKLGLMEVTRKKVRKPLQEILAGV